MRRQHASSPDPLLFRLYGKGKTDRKATKGTVANCGSGKESKKVEGWRTGITWEEDTEKGKNRGKDGEGIRFFERREGSGGMNKDKGGPTVFQMPSYCLPLVFFSFFR